MKFKLTKKNLNLLSRKAELVRKKKYREFKIELDTNAENIFPISEMAPFIYPILDQEVYQEIKLKNFPFCSMNQDSRDHIVENIDFHGKKIKSCQCCVYYSRCPGFPRKYFKKYGTLEVRPQKDVPIEAMLEIEPKCNFHCNFCFNKVSFAKNGRDIKPLKTIQIINTINDIANNGVKIIKFTGGEPMLRKDIFKLLRHAKKKGLETRLNTNCSLINKNSAKRLKGIVDNLLIPIECYNDKEEEKITGFKNALRKKIEAINLLKNAGVPIVRAGTVMTKRNIKNFDKITKFIFSLPLDDWEVYRPVPISKENYLSSKDINFLADKLISLRKRGRWVFIANAIPFCSIKNPNKLNVVSKGALYDEGHKRLVFDPRGFFKPHYFLDKNLGDNFKKAWQSDFARKMRILEFLPKECDGCPFVFKCCGGSRQAAKLFFGDYNKPDPLANFKNVKI